MSNLSRLSQRLMSLMLMLLLVGFLAACSEDEDVGGGGGDGTVVDPDGNQKGATGICTTDMADYVNTNLNNRNNTAWDGGQLYDKWWADGVIIGARAPVSDHLMWGQVSPGNNNTTRGAGTWRCKECHGWDYKGVSGEYGVSTSSHYTGAPGLYFSNKTPVETFCAIREGERINSRHVFDARNTGGAFSDVNILKLVKFLHATGSNAMTNSDDYIDRNGTATGNSSLGRTVYETTAGCGNSSCHGPDGTFVSDSLSSLGQLTNENPWEVLHKIRYGHPGSIMPAFIDDNLGSRELAVNEIRDVLAYSQSLTQANPGTTSNCINDYRDIIDTQLRLVDPWDGGRLYDKWWTEIVAPTPQGDHPDWSTQRFSNLMGQDTWRCKQCHGWDYKGVEGQYGDTASNNYTGFTGVLNARLQEPVQVFCAIKDAYRLTRAPNHKFADDPRTAAIDGLTDQDIYKLTSFIVTAGDNGLTDSDTFIDRNTGDALGDVRLGEEVYNITANCDSCHGVDGDLYAGSSGVTLGQLASDNPWEVLHKTRYGHPGSPDMPAYIDDDLFDNLTVNEIKNVLTYMQTLPGSVGGGGGTGTGGGTDLTPEECRIQKRSYVDREYDRESAAQGGALYDKWWTALGYSSGPSRDHAVFADADNRATASGQNTWRCKECHGWDYEGVNGAYGDTGSSHYTGFRGIMAATNDQPIDVFCSIYAGNARQPEHKFNSSNSRLTDQAILQLTKFITDPSMGVIDMRQYINLDGTIDNANINRGDTEFNDRCSSCHGVNGDRNSGSTTLGSLAIANPWEVLHKIRFGHPGSSPVMPAFVQTSLSETRMRDIVAFVQTLPEGTGTGNGNGGVISGDEELIMGALLYDNWIAQKGGDSPRNDNPVWDLQSTNNRTGSDTWRCKECHGWDYKGKDGNYGFDSDHYTGFDGLLRVNERGGANERTIREVEDTIRGGFVIQGERMHDYGRQLNDTEIQALAVFIKEGGVVDTSDYISEPGGNARGDVNSGEDQYIFRDFSPRGNCSLCHGLDGREINFGSGRNPEYLGDLANINPWEVLHKARFGSPGSIMPSMYGTGLSIQLTTDVLEYAQERLPVVND